MVDLTKIGELDDASQREIFSADSTLEALEKAAPYIDHLRSLAGDEVDFIVLGGRVNAESGEPEIDVSAWPDDYNGEIVVSTLSRKRRVGTDAEGNAINKNVIEAVIAHPIPDLESMLETDLGREMIRTVMYKELNHRFFRPLRGADNILAMTSEMPISIESYAISSRADSKSAILEAFNKMAKDILKLFKERSPTWSRARLTKAELRTCLASTAYANHFYGAVESEGLFVTALTLFEKLAVKKEFDSQMFINWRDSRDDAQFTPDEIVEDDLDLSSLVSAFEDSEVVPGDENEDENGDTDESEDITEGNEPLEPGEQHIESDEDASEAPAEG